jgi:tryptophanyl-tRNA synthetase
MIQNLFDLMSLVSKPDVLKHYDDQYRSMRHPLWRYEEANSRGYDSLSRTHPRAYHERSVQSQVYLTRVMKEGGERARASAERDNV